MPVAGIEVNVKGRATYQAAPDLDLTGGVQPGTEGAPVAAPTFTPHWWIFTLETGTNSTVGVNWSGKATDDLLLVPGVSIAIPIDLNARKVWLREAVAGAAGTQKVWITAGTRA